MGMAIWCFYDQLISLASFYKSESLQLSDFKIKPKQGLQIL